MTAPIRIVPLHRPRPDTAAAVPGIAAPPAAQLTYRGGPLLTAVQVFSVYWGAAWNDAAQQATMQKLNGFLQFIVASPYVDQLAEYNTPQHKIAHGSYIGTATITDPPTGTSVTDAAIQQMLEQQVARKALPPPAPTPNTLYVAFLPPGVTVVAGKDRSCQVFCGYHDRSAAQLFYAVLPYPNCAGCLGGVGVLDALTSVCSHELAEAITDPIPGQGWYDDTQGEIGDVCAWQNKKLGSYLVQLLWSNRARACV
ncbi:MAG TPA: hypothetical protein VGU74_06040 [Gemmatimonadales bacterium]|nr:hypothetical protein [Gemmatimonadales bacterium]